jgi:hypothetical protein
MNDTVWTPGWRIRMIEDMYEDITIESQEWIPGKTPWLDPRQQLQINRDA